MKKINKRTKRIIKKIIKELEDSLPNVGARDLQVEDFNNDDYFFGQACAKSDAIELHAENEDIFLQKLSSEMFPKDPENVKDIEPFDEGYNDQAWMILKEIEKRVCK